MDAIKIILILAGMVALVIYLGNTPPPRNP